MTATEPAAPSRATQWMGWLLAIAVSALAFVVPAPYGWAVLPLGITLQLGAAALALGHAPEPSLLQTLSRRLPVALLWVLLGAGLIAALCLWPLRQLAEQASLPLVLLLSVALTAAWLGLWRHWPLLALAFVDRPRRRGRMALIAHCVGESRRLVAADPSSGRGLLAALFGLLLLAGGQALLWLAPAWPAIWQASAGLLWSLLFAPGLAFVLLALVEPARLSARSAAPALMAEPVPVKAANLVPTLLPGDPTARLLAAARLGRIDDALAALEAGADARVLPAPEDRDQRTLAMLAAVLPDTRLLRRLIAAGVDLNQRHAGLTALLAATRDSLRGRPDAVMTLLANGADPRAADAEGRSALHFAALLAEPDIAALLLDAGAPLDLLNRDGYSPLGVACAAGNWRIARFLLERKAKCEPSGGQPTLLAAAGGEDDPAGVQLLLRHKAKPDARGRLGRSALLSAALAGNAEIVKALLEAGADPDLADEHGVSPLLEAARAGANAVLRQLPAARINAAACDSSGRNALVLACQSQRADGETIALLLGLGVDPQQPAGDGRRALDCALAQGRWPLVQALAPDYPIPTSHGVAQADPHSLQAALDHDARPWPARLDEALAEHDLGRVEAILRQVAPAPEELFEFALRQAPRLGREALDRISCALPLDWLQRDPSPLWAALSAGSTEFAAALRRRGASAGGIALVEWMALRWASGAGSADELMALELLGAGVDAARRQRGNRRDCLQLAVRLRWHRLLETLLCRGSDPNLRGADGNTPLHVAAIRGDAHALALLLRFGARIEARNSEGCAPCGLAQRHGHDELRDWLEWRGWQLPARRLRDADLVAAAAQGDAAALERLLALGLAIEARDAQGASALIRAAGGGHLAAAQLLIARGADLQAAASSGATSLSAAISMRHRAVVEALLDAGADLNQPLPGGITPLMVAAALGLPEMLVMLLDRGARIEQIDEAGNSALHALAQFGFTARDQARAVACWRALLGASGVIADAPGQQDLSPLLLLLGARAEPGHPVDEDSLCAQLEVLLAYSVDLDRRDSRGFGPLHLCALHGQLKSLRRLLAAGADREARDTLNRRPQDIAVMRGFVDLSAELEPVGSATPAPSLARFLKQPNR